MSMRIGLCHLLIAVSQNMLNYLKFGVKVKGIIATAEHNGLLVTNWLNSWFLKHKDNMHYITVIYKHQSSCVMITIKVIRLYINLHYSLA